VTITVSSGGHVVKELYGQSDASGVSRPRWKIGVAEPAGKLTAVATAKLLVLDSYDCTGGLVYQAGSGTADPLANIKR